MQSSDIPVKLPIPFGNSAGSGYIRQVPTASQIGITAGAASLTDGFVPVNFQPVASGGVPPFGQDVNGILNQVSAWARWASAGAPVAWDAAFSSAVGGYPRGALVQGTTLGAFWLSTTENNTTNPNTGGAGWQSLFLGLAPVASPTFTGVPAAPTASLGVATTQLATTKFVNPGSSLADPGWRYNADGSLDQWGVVSSVGVGETAITFPTSFPNAVLNVQASIAYGGGTPGNTTISVRYGNNNEFFVYNTTGSIGVSWRALGR